jgi:uncharacterized protein YceK
MPLLLNTQSRADRLVSVIVQLLGCGSTTSRTGPARGARSVRPADRERMLLAQAWLAWRELWRTDPSRARGDAVAMLERLLSGWRKA